MSVWTPITTRTAGQYETLTRYKTETVGNIQYLYDNALLAPAPYKLVIPWLLEEDDVSPDFGSMLDISATETLIASYDLPAVATWYARFDGHIYTDGLFEGRTFELRLVHGSSSSSANNIGYGRPLWALASGEPVPVTAAGTYKNSLVGDKLRLYVLNPDGPVEEVGAFAALSGILTIHAIAGPNV